MIMVNYYVVWKWVKTGIFTDRNQVKDLVSNYPQSKYKKFSSLSEAEEAFQQWREPFYQKKASWCTYLWKISPNSIAVDAACSWNPWKMEYRWIDLLTNQEVFHEHFSLWTNNIWEFLALVEWIKYVQNGHENYLIYSDSKIALNWIKNKTCNTSMLNQSLSPSLYKKIDDAELFLQWLQHFPPMIKRDTENWGEIPADFWRK